MATNVNNAERLRSYFLSHKQRENIRGSVQAAWFHCSHKATVKELIEHFKSV